MEWCKETASVIFHLTRSHPIDVEPTNFMEILSCELCDEMVPSSSMNRVFIMTSHLDYLQRIYYCTIYRVNPLDGQIDISWGFDGVGRCVPTLRITDNNVLVLKSNGKLEQAYDTEGRPVNLAIDDVLRSRTIADVSTLLDNGIIT